MVFLLLIVAFIYGRLARFDSVIECYDSTHPSPVHMKRKPKKRNAKRLD